MPHFDYSRASQTESGKNTTDQQPDCNHPAAKNKHSLAAILSKHPTTCDTANKNSGKLEHVINGKRRPFAVKRRELGNNRRQQGFECIEGAEKHHNPSQ